MDELTTYTGPERRRPDPAHAAMIAAAVAEGIREAVADPATWDAAGQAMQDRAQRVAGGWLIGGARALLQRAAWVVAILSGVYALGGWGAVVAWVKGH